MSLFRTRRASEEKNVDSSPYDEPFTIYAPIATKPFSYIVNSNITHLYKTGGRFKLAVQPGFIHYYPRELPAQ